MPLKVTYFSRFMPSYEYGGGCRRMVQIYEMLKAIYPQLELIANARGDRIPEALINEIITVSQQDGFGASKAESEPLQKWSEDQRGMVYRLKEFAEIWVNSIPELAQLDLVIMDDPIYFLPLFEKLQQLHVPVIAVCHNIETLAPNQVEKKWALGLLKEELEILSQCRLVITISREETVLLNNLGITTLYIPYYPVAPIQDRLLAVREKRQQQVKNGIQKDGILMVGTTKNLQTLGGVIRVASYWQHHQLDQVIGRLIIGGYNIEKYFDPQPYGEAVDFRGTLSNEDLDALLSRIKAFLCYQESGSGSLTRICEMLIAGVPVLANAHAARSYYNHKGIVEFQILEQLKDFLPRLHTVEGDIPVPLSPDPAYLLSELNNIMGPHG